MWQVCLLYQSKHLISPFFLSENEGSNVEHNDMYYVGVIIGLSAAIAGGLLNITVSFCKDIHSLVLLWWSGIGGLLVSVISANVDSQRQILSPDIIHIDLYVWLAFWGMALAGILSFFFVTRSLQLIDPTTVAFVRALEIVFAYVAQVTILQQMPTTLAIIGAGCVMASVLAVALEEKVQKFMPQKIRFLC